MPDLLQEPDLILRILQVLLAHIARLNALNNVVFAFSLVPGQVDLAEATASNRLDYLVNVHTAV